MPEVALAYYYILKAGGFTSGGTNFDAKLRRQIPFGWQLVARRQLAAQQLFADTFAHQFKGPVGLDRLERDIQIVFFFYRHSAVPSALFTSFLTKSPGSIPELSPNLALFKSPQLVEPM